MAITAGEVREIVFSAVAMAAGIDVEELSEHDELITRLEMDSLAIYELAIELEETFTLQIPDEDIERISTIKDVIDYIIKQITPSS